MNNSRIQKASIILFVGTLGFLCFGSLLCPDRQRSELEARRMTQRIEYTSFSQYLDRSLFQNIENYVSDQMLGRDAIEGLYADIQRLTGHRYINNRILLKDGQIVEIYQNQQDIEGYAEIISKINKKYQQAAIPFLFVSTPVKASVVAQKETWQGQPISNREVEVRKFFKLLHDAEVDTLDLTKSMQNLYDNGINPYYKTDHHWNYQGVYAGYQSLMKALAEKGMSTAGLSETEFGIYTDFHKFYGSGLRTMGGTILFSGQYDTVRVRYPLNGTFRMEREGKEVKEGNGEIFIDSTIYEEQEDKYLDYYNIHLGGNCRKIIIHNQSVSGEEKLVLVGDSFSLSMLPMLARSFKEIHYFDSRHLNMPVTEYAEEIQADYVVFMFNANLAADRYRKIQ